MSSLTKKFGTYLSACYALGSPNWKGLPGFPKSLTPALPYNRQNYNTFITWISRLDLANVKSIVDIGANHGDFSIAANACHPSTRTLLFEPLPSLHKELARRASVHKGWILDPRAVGSCQAILPLHLPEGQDDIASLTGFSTTYESATGKQSAHATLECEVIPLDQALEEYGISHLNLIKIDVEGFEFEVLKGAQQTLKNTEALIIELSLIRQQNESAEPLAQMAKILEQNHFRVVDVIPSLYSNLHPWMPVEYNILARKAA